MTKSKPSSRNSVKAALLLFNFSLCIILSGCQESFSPTYREEDIPYFVKQICKDEYKLDVVTQRTGATFWIYVPLPRILHKEYGITEGKVLDEEMLDKLRNIIITVGRVLLSSDNVPEFFAIWASDINIGLDYIFVGNVMDIKRAFVQTAPVTEFNKRYVLMKFAVNPEAIKDTVGRHIEPYDIKFADFLAQQMVQRVSYEFQGEKLKKYFRAEKVDGIFNNDTFILEYSIQPLLKPKKNIDVMKKVLNTMTYCLKIYDFQDFSRVQIYDLVTQDKITLNKAVVLARVIPEE